jgi:hypothetical protein
MRTPAEIWSAYPPDWPQCPGCGLPALDGHITCGQVECNEAGRRAAAAIRAALALPRRRSENR